MTWCEATRSACDKGVLAKSCENYAQYCPPPDSAALPEQTSNALAEQDSAELAGAVPGEDSALDSSAGDQVGSSLSGGSCGLVPQRAASGALRWTLGCLGLSWLMRRRRGLES